MDRLLCGDVGYGKTEVALRAAFKAVQDSKQAAFLVPPPYSRSSITTRFLRALRASPYGWRCFHALRARRSRRKPSGRSPKGRWDVIVVRTRC